MVFRKILYYLNPLTMFRKTQHPEGINLRMMHGINRISLFMFLVGLVVVLIKIFSK